MSKSYFIILTCIISLNNDYDIRHFFVRVITNTIICFPLYGSSLSSMKFINNFIMNTTCICSLNALDYYSFSVLLQQTAVKTMTICIVGVMSSEEGEKTTIEFGAFNSLSLGVP